MISTPIRPPHSPQRASEAIRPKRAVVAVADESRRALLGKELAENGYEVLFAPTHCEAVNFVRKDSITFAVLDADPIRLQSGWLACRKITYHCRAVRAVIVGKEAASPEMARRAAFSGASGYFDESASFAAMLREAIAVG